MGQDRAEHPLILPVAALLWAAEAATGPSLRQAIEGAVGCPPAASGEIVICRRRDPAEPYRIPKALRGDGFDFSQERIDSVSRERHRLMEGGGGGIGSCSPSGAGGSTGCLVKRFREWEQQQAGH